jgi:uncharacterized membrane protein
MQAQRIGLGIAVASLAGVAVATLARPRHSERVSKTFTVNRPPEQVAQLWLDLDLLPKVENVRFDPAPGGRGTEVRVRFRPRLMGKLRKTSVQEQLREFKQLAETGEIAAGGAL